MNKDEAQTVKKGDFLNLFDHAPTPGRADLKQYLLWGGRRPIKRILVEKTGHVHFDIGIKLPEGAAPLKSRDTGEELDGSNTYWLHPSRFEVKPFTWDELAAAIAKLPEEQRKKQVCISIEDEGTVKGVEDLTTIPDDIYGHKENEDDIGDLETLKETHGADFKQEDYEIITPAGTPFLWDGF